MDLLLAHGDDGSPMLGHQADPGTAAGYARPIPRREEKILADITANANDLASQHWAVVVPEGTEGARLEALVRELVAVRAEDQHAEVLTIRVPPGMDAQTATAWKKNVYPALYGNTETRRPRYLLILGDLDGVSLDTQQALAQSSLPGRLACTSDDGYGAYVDKVLAWQRTPSPHARPRALFYTVHDGTSATTAGHAKLIQPCHELCASTARDKVRAFPASAIETHGAQTPDPRELLALAAVQHPSVLLSMSHGMGPPRRHRWSPAEARERQGAMCFGTEGAITAQDVASVPFLPGGLWIYFACFGAGTPRTSTYRHWLDMLAQHGMADLARVSATLQGLDESDGFISGLAKAALANPNGPLAILGHIDLAWSYSYEELLVHRDGSNHRIAGSNQSINFFNFMTKLVAGERAGAALLLLRLAIDGVSEELTTHYNRHKQRGTAEGATAADALELGNLWMRHRDLLSYMLLGDPAVQLPLAPPSVQKDSARAAPADSSAERAEVRLPVGSGVPRADASELDRLEQAVCKLMGGDSLGVVATQLDLQRDDVRDAERVYREAGRAALAALLDRRRAEEKGRPR